MGSLVTLILSAFISTCVSYYFNKKAEINRIRFDKKLESYSRLINLAKAFMNDPSLQKENAKQMANEFIEKYNNEILPFAPKNVVVAVQEFLFNSWTKYADSNSQTKSLIGVIQAIRKDLELENLDEWKIEFHAINEDVHIPKKNNRELSSQTLPNQTPETLKETST